MKIRREYLLACALALGVADAAYVLWLGDQNDDEMIAQWVAYMPALETKQRRDPFNYLNTSETHDPDYPSLYVFEGDQAYPVFSKIAGDCGVQAYTISHYVGPTKTNAAVDMPARLFLGGLTDAMAACVQRELPKGYVLARLDGEFRPNQIGWGEKELPLAAIMGIVKGNSP